MFDQQVVKFFASVRNPVVTYLMKDISFLGSAIFISLLIVGFYIFKERHEDAWKLSFVFLLSNVISLGLKYIFARPRPSLAIQKAFFYSFPSTHATLVFSITYVLCDIYKHKIKARIYFYTLAVLVAMSRIYLGVHYFSDVFFGGLIGILIGFFVVEYFNRLKLFVN